MLVLGIQVVLVNVFLGKAIVANMFSHLFQILNYFDYIFTSVFTVEIIVKVSS